MNPKCEGGERDATVSPFVPKRNRFEHETLFGRIMHSFKFTGVHY